jgi:CubicO group peptidase (beta-lactamase class C family)
VTATPRDPAAFDGAFALAARKAANGTAPFVILAVADADGLIRAEAHPGRGAPGVDLDAVCLVASITKPVVATAIMRLVADGELTLTDPIDRYLPAFAAPGKPAVTIWHLLTHTSGIPDFDLLGLVMGRVERPALVRRSLEAPLRFMPGSRFEYVSSSFDLLGAIIETISGETCAGILRRVIFDPLGMAGSTFDPWDGRAGRVAPLAIANEAGGSPTWAPLVLSDEERRAFSALALPGAGLFSTAADLVRFGRAMLRGGELDGVRILPPAFVELMTREQTTGAIGAAADPLLDEHYGLGWGKASPRTSPASPAAFGHGGATGTRLWIDPWHDLVFVHLTGVWSYPSREIDEVQNAVYAALR